MTVGSLFAGIGGIELGLERTGRFRTRWQVENDPFCVRVLEKHWPRVQRFGDIREVRDLPKVDLVSGGFPCQPVSVAGKKRGQRDPRWLWPEFARVLALVRPRYVLVENVPGLLHRGMGDVLLDLASLGYAVEWDCIPASAVGAPHRRDRVWIVAYAEGGKDLKRGPGDVAGTKEDGEGRNASLGLGGAALAHPAPLQRETVGRSQRDGLLPPVLAHPEGLRGEGMRQSGLGLLSGLAAKAILDRCREGSGRAQWLVEPDVGRVAHGIPGRVDRLRSLGNAVVPQVAEAIGRMIWRFEQERRKAAGEAATR